jgi:hypothetical protein
LSGICLAGLFASGHLLDFIFAEFQGKSRISGVAGIGGRGVSPVGYER